MTVGGDDERRRLSDATDAEQEDIQHSALQGQETYTDYGTRLAVVSRQVWSEEEDSQLRAVMSG